MRRDLAPGPKHREPRRGDWAFVQAPDALGALRERNFSLFFAGQSVSLLGDGIVPLALAFAVLTLNGSPSVLGLVFAARLLATLVLLPLGGVAADRFSRRGVMIAADLLRVLTQGAAAGILITGTAQVWMVAALAAVAGGASAFFNPASTGLIPMIVGVNRLQQANALRGLSQAAGAIAGPALAGVLVAIAGPGVALGVDGGSFALSAAFLFGLRMPIAEGQPERSRFIDELQGGWREVRGRDWVWSIIGIAAIANMLGAAYYVLGPVIADRELGGAAAWATISTAFGVGSLLGAALILRRRVTRPLVVAVTAGAAWVVPWYLLAIPASTALIAAGALLGGLGLMVFNALWEASLQEHIPWSSLSRVSAYDWLGSLALAPLGMAIIGPMSAAVGFRATLLGCATVVTGLNAVALMIPGVRWLRSGTAADQRLRTGRPGQGSIGLRVEPRRHVNRRLQPLPAALVSKQLDRRHDHHRVEHAGRDNWPWPEYRGVRPEESPPGGLEN
jgi:Major Facilitator Superfamily